MLDTAALRLIFAAALIVAICGFLRLLYILPSTHPTRPKPRAADAPAHLLIVLGSGGHTTEMFSLIRDVQPHKYTRRTYVVSSGDSISAARAKEFEDKLAADHATKSSPDRRMNSQKKNKTKAKAGAEVQQPASSTYIITTVPRARKIHQPIYTTPFSSLQCLASALLLLRRDHPDVILTNGPATGVIVVIAALLLKFVGARGTAGKMRSIYVESWARVKSLSLSGKIMLYLVDRFFVQWETLKAVSTRAEWKGFLVR